MIRKLSIVGLALASTTAGGKHGSTAGQPTPATLSYRVLVLDPIPFADPSKTPEGEARMFQPP